MRKLFIGILATVALAGITNCVLIEPVYAYKEDNTASSTDDSERCFFSCSIHHPCIPPVSSGAVFTTVTSVAFIFSVSAFNSDPPAGSIFHPPII